MCFASELAVCVMLTGPSLGGTRYCKSWWVLRTPPVVGTGPILGPVGLRRLRAAMSRRATESEGPMATESEGLMVTELIELR